MTDIYSIARKLHLVWVGPIAPFETYDLARVHASMLQEHRWNLKNPARCTPACARETRGQLVLLGKVRKALGI